MCSVFLKYVLSLIVEYVLRQALLWAQQIKNNNKGSSSLDGGVGSDPLLLRTTKRRTTTNLKSINNQKHQKIKLHGTRTTKELKKKSTRTTRPVRRQTMRADSEKPQRGGRPRGQGQLLHRWGWLKPKLRLRGGCGLWQLLRWEQLPVSH